MACTGVDDSSTHGFILCSPPHKHRCHIPLSVIQRRGYSPGSIHCPSAPLTIPCQIHPYSHLAPGENPGFFFAVHNRAMSHSVSHLPKMVSEYSFGMTPNCHEIRV